MRISLASILNVAALLLCMGLFSGLLPFFTEARNVAEYSDTITSSRPQGTANHTMRFTPTKAIAPSAAITIQFPPDFSVAASSTLFAERNVELYVNGVARDAAASAAPTVDGVSITRGAGGSIAYTLSSTEGIDAESEIELRIGNHTSVSVGAYFTPATTTGSTTIATSSFSGDIKPITNALTVGTHTIDFEVVGVAEPIYGQFHIAIVPAVFVGYADTTEIVPPYRFNGAPTSTVGGTTLSVEISLETDEFAVCKWAATSSVPYLSMPAVMDNTGLVVHSTVVAVTRGAVNRFFVRCLDDEGNYNTDDYVIEFAVNDAPTGTANETGDVDGDGSGSGNDGGGTGQGGGGTQGGSEGETSTTGGSSGGGGTGGGGGGRTGPTSEGDTGGGLESADGQYPSGDAEVIINGYAFPGSTVYAIVDGTAAENVRAGSNGAYSITISQIARGAYTFGIYAVDRANVKSSTFSTSFTVTGGRTSSLSNINVMPSIKVTPDPVNPGQTLTISGYSIPNATVTVENQKDGTSASKKEFTATSDNGGAWQLTIDTNAFSKGTYKIRAKAKATAGLIETNYSNYTFYGVGQSSDVKLNADLNTDGKVNLTDFSILLFWWGKDGGNSNPPADINSDGTVSLTDFSILLFNWTG